VRIQQSFCYPCFKTKEMSLDTVCREAAAIGLKAVELWFRGPDFDELVATAKKHRLVIASMCGHKSLTDGLNKPENHDRIEAELRESLEIAARVGIPGLICFSGNRNEGQGDEEALDVCAAGLRRVTPAAEKLGINLNMELLNSKVDHKGYQCDHTAWGVAMCRRVGSPRAKLLYDIYHMQIMEGDVIRTIRENIQWIGHFHTAGNPERRDLDDAQELNYVGICRAIAATGYDLYMGHEFTPRGERIDGLRRGFAVCDQE
jgi:hydroxypyruvate isomerase